jgi:tetratricopeptide (TPR) repeat protein
MAGRQDIFQDAMNKGHSAAWDQQWEQAAKHYRQALDEFPNHPNALSSLGMAMFEMKDFEEALKIYTKAGQISPEDPLTAEKIAQVCERLGKLPECIQASLKAADLFLKARDMEKAVHNWNRILRLDPDHLGAHSRLATVFERAGRKSDAVNEYLAMAAVMQQSGVVEKATQVVEYALKLVPGHAKAEEALQQLRASKPLAKPSRPQGTGPFQYQTGGLAPGGLVKKTDKLQPAREPTKPLQTPKPVEEKLDLISQGKKNALVKLADLLFEQNEEANTGQVARRGLQAIMRGTGSISLDQAERNKVMMHLGQAVDAETQGNEPLAAEELEHAVEAGLDHTAAYYLLGLLRYQTDRYDSAIKYLGHAIKHPDFTLPAHLLLALSMQKMGRSVEAGVEFLQALKYADIRSVPDSQADELLQLYEPLIEEQSKTTDRAASTKLCESIASQLVSPDWKDNLDRARDQMPQQMPGSPPLPLAEIFLELGSHQIIESISRVRSLGNRGMYRTAMEESFFAVQYAPTYLPLHIQIADMLVKEGLVQEAIDKYTVVANTFSSRGEFSQTTSLLRRVVGLAPMDLAARSRLIDQLVSQGMVGEALKEYLDLAEIYNRLAELDMARKTLTIALRLSQQSITHQAITVDILNRVADIDLQRLDWKQAVRSYEQIRTIDPGDIKARTNLIDINLRMGQDSVAIAELDSFIAYLETTGQQRRIIPFMEDITKERPDYLELHQRLAELYRQAGMIQEAVGEFDRVGDMLMDAGNRTGTIAVIQTIISLNPPNIADYRAILEKLQSGMG